MSIQDGTECLVLTITWEQGRPVVKCDMQVSASAFEYGSIMGTANAAIHSMLRSTTDVLAAAGHEHEIPELLTAFQVQTNGGQVLNSRISVHEKHRDPGRRQR